MQTKSFYHKMKVESQRLHFLFIKYTVSVGS